MPLGYNIVNLINDNKFDINQTLNFIDSSVFYYTQGENYKINEILSQPGVSPTIMMGDTSINYVLGDIVSGFDQLKITVDVFGAINIKGKLV